MIFLKFFLIFYIIFHLSIFINKKKLFIGHAALIVDGDLSDDLVDVLTHIFNRFDKDKDEALNR